MRISVVMPVRDGQAYLRESIESVLATHPYEFIVVDDGSSDSTPDIVQSYPGLRYERQDPAGAAQARNRGVSLATGELIAFQDADDLWSPQKCTWQLALLEAEPGLAGVFGGVVQFASAELSPQDRARLDFDPRPQAAWLPACFLVRRHVLEAVGPFDPQYRAGDFIDWCARSQEQGFLYGCVPQVVLHRRLHLGNFGRTQRDARQDYARLAMAAFKRRQTRSLTPH